MVIFKKSIIIGEDTMGHITSRNHYDNLVARLNRFPQGAPPSETLYKLLMDRLH